MASSIENIFNKSRFTHGPQLLFLILYIPLGLCLFTLRVFISFQLCLASLVLPPGTLLRRFVLRVLYTVMGIIVREKDFKRKDENSKIIIANHITPFDHIAFSLVYPCISVSVYNLPGPLSSILCFRDFGMTGGREVLKNNIRSYVNKPESTPVLIHPEGATTNGSVALMKYGSWAFEINNSILVIGLNVHRVPFLPLAPSVLGGSWTADLFFMLFSPFTVYTVRYIGKLSKEDSETVESFATRVQNATATTLNLEASNYTVSDKLEYIKKLAREEIAPPISPLTSDIHLMAQRVKEVLPYLPMDMIERDLLRTRNIDTSITNFLEGTVPEPIPLPSLNEDHMHDSTLRIRNVGAPSSTRDGQTETTATTLLATSKDALSNLTSSKSLNMAAKTFGKCAEERMQSYHERKQQLIERARRKYLEKHGLIDSSKSC